MERKAPQCNRRNVEKLVKARLATWDQDDLYEFVFTEYLEDYLGGGLQSEFAEDWLTYVGEA